MKRSTLFFTSLILFIGAYSQPRNVVADKIIAVVGDKIILKSDLDNSVLDMQRQGVEAIPPNARCMILQQAMGIKALVLQAEKDSLPITEEEIATDIDNRIRYFISQYGSKEELEKIAGKTIYQLKEDFKEGIHDQKLAQSMRSKIVEGIKITPNEVNDFYRKIPHDSLPLYESEVEIGQIVLYPKPSRDADEYCQEQLRDIKAQVESGKKDFCLLARNNSEDPGSKDNCGKYEVNRNEKNWDPTFLSKAFTLKANQISNPFKSKFGYHILQLVSRAGDDAVVRHILKIPQVTQYEIRQTYDKLDSIRSMLIAGTIAFGEAVNKFSEDDASKFTAGSMLGKNGSTGLTIDELDKDMVAMLKNLTLGKYSQPVEFTDEKGKKGMRIVVMKSKTEPHRENLKDDYNRIAQRALEDKKNDALENWFNKKIPTYYVMVDTEYRGCTEMKKWVGKK